MGHPCQASANGAAPWPITIASMTGSTSRRKSSLISGTVHYGMNAEGIFRAETIFESTIMLSTGRVTSVRWIGGQHVREDLGFIPSFADWVKAIRPESWMGRALPLEGSIVAVEGDSS